MKISKYFCYHPKSSATDHCLPLPSTTPAAAATPAAIFIGDIFENLLNIFKNSIAH